MYYIWGTKYSQGKVLYSNFQMNFVFSECILSKGSSDKRGKESSSHRDVLALPFTCLEYWK